jgi:hypothetical protein
MKYTGLCVNDLIYRRGATEVAAAVDIKRGRDGATALLLALDGGEPPVRAPPSLCAER